MTGPLPSAEVITAESPIGVFPFAAVGSTATVDVPSKDKLLNGIGLMAPQPAGTEVDGVDLVRRVSEEMGTILGGWFATDLSPYMRLYDSLASPELQQYYAAGGMTMTWDEPATAFSWLAFRSPPWQVQAVGDAGDFHCVSFGHPLAEKEAVGPGGHPRPRPVVPPVALLHDAAPAVISGELEDESELHPPNLYDTYLTADRVTVKGGVRMRLDGMGALAGYFYGVRVVVRL